ncbi:hypothetical protein HN358_02965 [Candidatus Uhrbacteria bacterium]|jgi:hypothetical protein|nr:hypothetical protein [Candidatus Uhrbacteria bacterium]MBT7717161.1 hypothetical protein [Candidatus Uhrbacteria bacterium]
MVDGKKNFALDMVRSGREKGIEKRDAEKKKALDLKKVENMARGIREGAQVMAVARFAERIGEIDPYNPGLVTVERALIELGEADPETINGLDWRELLANLQEAANAFLDEEGQYYKPEAEAIFEEAKSMASFDEEDVVESESEKFSDRFRIGEVDAGVAWDDSLNNYTIVWHGLEPSVLTQQEAADFKPSDLHYSIKKIGKNEADAKMVFNEFKRLAESGMSSEETYRTMITFLQDEAFERNSEEK